jgi:hypothetical protein
MLMGVKPGMVLISLIQTPPEARSRKKSTRARPLPSSAAKALSASVRISSAVAASNRAGISSRRVYVLTYFDA